MTIVESGFSAGLFLDPIPLCYNEIALLSQYWVVEFLLVCSECTATKTLFALKSTLGLLMTELTPNTIIRSVCGLVLALSWITVCKAEDSQRDPFLKKYCFACHSDGTSEGG